MALVIVCPGDHLDPWAEQYSVIAPWVRWVGASLSFGWPWCLFFAPQTQKTGNRGHLTFAKGLVLQLVNPKVILYGITVDTSFASILSGSFLTFAVSSMTVWALTGAVLGRVMKGDRSKSVFNLVMAALLGWCAVSIALH